MRTLIVALALGLASLATSTPVAAAPFTDHFDALIAELLARRDGELSGDLDKAGKKQLQAVLAALKALDKDADDLGDDLQTLLKAGVKLTKAFPAEFGFIDDEFGNTVEAPATSLGELVGAAALALDADVQAAHADLEALIPTLSEKGAAKVAKLSGKVLTLLGSVSDALPVKPFAKSRFKAWKLIVKGEKVAAADKAPGGGATSLVMTLDGDPLTGDASTKIEVHASNDLLQVSSALPSGDVTYYIVLAIENVTGPGTFALTGAGVSAFVNCVPAVGDGTLYDVDSGSLEVTSYDKAKRIVGTFSFTATNGGAGTLTVTAGSFDITDIELY